MPGYINNISVNRIIDANINRAKEGLRVSEEVTRFIFNSQKLSSGIKKLRHKIDAVAIDLVHFKELLNARDARRDVGRKIYANELKRENVSDIFFANIQRAKESVRVLEEFSKLKNRKLAIKFKEIRYGIYEFEKEAVKLIKIS